MRGKPQQPSAIAKLKGTYQKCRYEEGLDDKMNFIYNTIPNPPDHLTKTGQKFWIEVLSQTQKVNGYLSFIDLGVFTVLCEIYEEMVSLQKSTGDLVIIHKNGSESINPRHRHLRELRRQYLEYCREFGFTPSSRGKIKIENLPNNPPEEEFIL